MRVLAILIALFSFPLFAQSEPKVEFRIKAGTEGNDWNTEENPVLVRAGERLVIYNDDTWTHQLHTFGQPCAHGRVGIPPGGFDDKCLIYQGSELGMYTLYDHRTLARFYVEVVASE